ncbi:MAG TPA: hypothetical protein VIL99_00590 [Ignavibacteria bacterium]
MQVLKLIFLLNIFSYCVCLHSSTAQRSLQTSGINSSLYSVHFVNNNLGFAVGDSGIILKTIDGGTNWSVKSVGSFLSLYGVRLKSSAI